MADIDKHDISCKENQIKIKSSKSLMEVKVRRDCHGNIISKKFKKHKITFKDQAEHDKQLAEVIIVKSFHTNGKNDFNIGFPEEENADWNCILF
jgi:hypothetical protein